MNLATAAVPAFAETFACDPASLGGARARGL